MFMMFQNYTNMPTHFIFFMIIAALWTVFWKGLALWHSARNKDNIWFIVFLFVNTLGILDIIYLFGIRKIKTDKLFK